MTSIRAVMQILSLGAIMKNGENNSAYNQSKNPA
jgi:hypothetical protein